MPCYHPLIRIVDGSKWEKAKDGHLYHPAKVYKSNKEIPAQLENLVDWEMHYNGSYEEMIIPCGKCIGCRLENSRQWANRGYLERQLYEEGYFLTLTYSNENLPKVEEIETSEGITYTDDGTWKGTLKKEDWKKFMHDLRQILERKYNQIGIRYLACGEYGEEGERPHMHAILLNIHLPQETFYNPKIINKNTYWKNTIIDQAWGKGFAELSEATWNDIAYTARYITKKINGEYAEDHYAAKGQIPEFFRTSNQPGIAKPYFDKHYEEIYKNDEIIVKNMAGVVRMQPPKYFDRLYKEMDPKAFKKIQENRKKRAKYSNKIKDETTSLFRLDQLEIEERLQDEKTLRLVREFEKGVQ